VFVIGVFGLCGAIRKKLGKKLGMVLAFGLDVADGSGMAVVVTQPKGARQ